MALVLGIISYLVITAGTCILPVYSADTCEAVVIKLEALQKEKVEEIKLLRAHLEDVYKMWKAEKEQFIALLDSPKILHCDELVPILEDIKKIQKDQFAQNLRGKSNLTEVRKEVTELASALKTNLQELKAREDASAYGEVSFATKLKTLHDKLDVLENECKVKKDLEAEFIKESQTLNTKLDTGNSIVHLLQNMTRDVMAHLGETNTIVDALDTKFTSSINSQETGNRYLEMLTEATYRMKQEVLQTLELLNIEKSISDALSDLLKENNKILLDQQMRVGKLEKP